MRNHLAMAPEYGSLNYEERFKAFLFTAIHHFEENVDYKALFQKCHVKNDWKQLNYLLCYKTRVSKSIIHIN